MATSCDHSLSPSFLRLIYTRHVLTHACLSDTITALAPNMEASQDTWGGGGSRSQTGEPPKMPFKGSFRQWQDRGLPKCQTGGPPKVPDRGASQGVRQGGLPRCLTGGSQGVPRCQMPDRGLSRCQTGGPPKVSDRGASQATRQGGLPRCQTRGLPKLVSLPLYRQVGDELSVKYLDGDIKTGDRAVAPLRDFSAGPWRAR